MYREFVASPRKGTALLVLGFCLALAFTFFFGYRAGRTARRSFHEKAGWQNEPIRPWMSVPFVAHTYHTREKVLFEAIHVPPDPRDRRPIRTIARAKNVPVAELIRELEEAIATAGPAGSETAPSPRAP
jgi:hypothetical protein